MTIRSKTFTIVGLVLLACMALCFAVAFLLVPVGMGRTAESAAKEVHALRVADIEDALDATRRAIEADVGGLAERVAALARRDDTYVESRSAAYRRASLPDSICQELGLSALVIVGSSGRIVDRLSYDLERHVFGELPATLVAELAPGMPLVSQTDPNGMISGILLLPEGPMLVAACPIVPRVSRGPPRGTFLLGRLLTPGQLEALAGGVGAEVRLSSLDAAEIPREERAALQPGGAPVVRELDGGALAGYALLDDIWGSPTVLARVAPSGDTAAPAAAALADLERVARDATIWLAAMLLGSALIVLGTTLLVQETTVLRRTAALAARLGEIASSPEPGARVESHGDDELARLEISANELIAALEGATRQAADRERASAASAERTRLALQATGQVAFDVDVQGGRISLDGAVLRLTGYSLEELRFVPLSTWESMLHPEDRHAAVAAGEQAASTGAAYRIEYRLRRKDGTYATVEERGARAPGAAARIVGTMRIVTPRHSEEPPAPASSAQGLPPSPGSPV